MTIESATYYTIKCDTCGEYQHSDGCDYSVYPAREEAEAVMHSDGDDGRHICDDCAWQRKKEA